MAAGKTAAMTDGSAFGVSITNARGKHVYPIATFTWLLIPENGRDAVKNAATRDLIRWMLTTGQKQCEGLGYAPLPAELAARELKATGP
jgi:phosphate transport system substrate-binding protein